MLSLILCGTNPAQFYPKEREIAEVTKKSVGGRGDSVGVKPMWHIAHCLNVMTRIGVMIGITQLLTTLAANIEEQTKNTF